MLCLRGLLGGWIDWMAKNQYQVQEETRWLILGRARFHCEFCLGDLIGGVSIHHRRPRMMGGSRDLRLHQPANLIALCGSGTSGCHGWVESNRNKARELGLLILKVDSAEDVPFMDKEGNWWKIFNSGEKVRLDRKRILPDV